MELASHGTRPRFRTDLVAECIEADGQRFIDVIDPDTGDAFRFYEVEYSLACAMDGERDVVGLARWAKEELGIDPSPTELATVIGTLADLGYLERAPAADVALGRGVVAARPEPALPPATDVELGSPGASPVAAPPPSFTTAPADVELGDAGGLPTRRMDELTEDVELGLPGAPPLEPVAKLRRATRPDADDDGPTHLPPAAVGDFDDEEVSVDLSEHLSLRPDDVKEAVRMSRSMKAVEVPPELLDEVGQKEAEAAARASAAREAAETAAAEAARAAAAHEAERLHPTVPVEPDVPVAAGRPAVELPEKPVVVSRKRPTDRPADKAAEVKPPEPAPAPHKTSRFLIWLLVLVILGAGGFAVWKYVIDKPKADAAAGSTESTGPAQPGPDDHGTHAQVGTSAGTASGADQTGKVDTPPVPPPPAAPTATLEAHSDTVEVKAGKGGAVTFAVDDGTAVQEGDPIVQYKGAAPLLIKIGNSTSGLTYDVEKRYPHEIDVYSKERDAAQAAGNDKLAKAKQKKLDERQARLDYQKKKLDELRAKLAATSVVAPAAGTATGVVKKGAVVKADEVVARIDTGASLVATFDLTGQPGTPPAVNASVRIAAKDQPGQQANCAVSAVDGANVTVTCAADVGIPAGTVVTLEQ